jgi:hypothetical protein
MRRRSRTRSGRPPRASLAGRSMASSGRTRCDEGGEGGGGGQSGKESQGLEWGLADRHRAIRVGDRFFFCTQSLSFLFSLGLFHLYFSFVSFFFSLLVPFTPLVSFCTTERFLDQIRQHCRRARPAGDGRGLEDRQSVALPRERRGQCVRFVRRSRVVCDGGAFHGR